MMRFKPSGDGPEAKVDVFGWRAGESWLHRVGGAELRAESIPSCSLLSLGQATLV